MPRTSIATIANGVATQGNTDEIDYQAPAPYSRDEAFAFVDRVKRRDWDHFEDMITAYIRRVWEPLGYPDWDSFYTDQLGSLKFSLPRNVRRETVQLFAIQFRLGNRQIASILRCDHKTVAADLKALKASGVEIPEAREGLDGREYKSIREAQPRRTDPVPSAPQTIVDEVAAIAGVIVDDDELPELETTVPESDSVLDEGEPIDAETEEVDEADESEAEPERKREPIDISRTRPMRTYGDVLDEAKRAAEKLRKALVALDNRTIDDIDAAEATREVLVDLLDPINAFADRVERAQVIDAETEDIDED